MRRHFSEASVQFYFQIFYHNYLIIFLFIVEYLQPTQKRGNERYLYVISRVNKCLNKWMNGLISVSYLRHEDQTSALMHLNDVLLHRLWVIQPSLEIFTGKKNQKEEEPCWCWIALRDVRYQFCLLCFSTSCLFVCFSVPLSKCFPKPWCCGINKLRQTQCAGKTSLRSNPTKSFSTESRVTWLAVEMLCFYGIMLGVELPTSDLNIDLK